MKKKLLKLSILPFIYATPVMAKLNDPTTPNGISVNDTLDEMIGKISNAILAIVAVVAVMFLILAGFQYVSSAGNPEQIKKAKDTALYAIIGIIVAILAWSVVKFVIDKLG